MSKNTSANMDDEFTAEQIATAKSVWAKYQREYRAKNPEKVKQAKLRYLVRRAEREKAEQERERE